MIGTGGVELDAIIQTWCLGDKVVVARGAIVWIGNHRAARGVRGGISNPGVPALRRIDVEVFYFDRHKILRPTLLVEGVRAQGVGTDQKSNGQWQTPAEARKIVVDRLGEFHHSACPEPFFVALCP